MSKSVGLFVRCIGHCDGSQWTIVCLNFDLAAQAPTFDEARKLLDDQIRSYIREAMDGEDREHAQYLMNRRAPLSLWVRYYYAILRQKLHSAKSKNSYRERPFVEPLRLVPAY